MIDDPVYRLITDWHQRAQIDYHEAYIRLYISYNAWFQQVTGTTNTRAAMTLLKKRFVIWRDYEKGLALTELRPIMRRIVLAIDSTSPIQVNFKNEDDWKTLIEYWYQVRCNLFHGAIAADEPRYQLHIELAYTSLNIFMSEIITRMSTSFSKQNHAEMKQLTSLLQTDTTHHKQYQERFIELQQKFIFSPNIWDVDMI